MSNLPQNLTWQGGGPRVENYKILTMELSAVCTLSSTMGFGGYGRVIRAMMGAISDENLPKPSLFHCCAILAAEPRDSIDDLVSRVKEEKKNGTGDDNPIGAEDGGVYLPVLSRIPSTQL